MVEEKKPNKLRTSYGCGCLIVIVLLIFIFVLAYGFSKSGNDSSALDDAKATYDQIVDLNKNADISPEEKARQAQDLMDKIEPIMTELEKQKDNELPQMNRNFQLWQSFVSMNDACNAIVQNDPAEYQQCIESASESLEKAEKEMD